MLLLVLAFTGVEAQHGVSSVPISHDPLFSIQASAGYFFWNAREVYDSTQGIVKDHREALNKGFRYGGDLMFHFPEGISLGATYRQLSTSHTTPSTHWSVPVTDSNNKVVIDPVTGNLLYGPRLGTVYEEIRLWFVGVRLTKEFDLGSNLFLGIGIAPGIVNYYEAGDFVGYEIEIAGSSLAFDITADLKYQFDRNWSALAQFSLFNGSIATPDYTDRQQSVVNYPLGEPQSVTNWSFNFGVRFTFNRPDKKSEYRRPPEQEPVSPKEDKRFQLAD